MIQKLNFGCGNDIRQGYDNVDIKGPIVCDFNFIPYKFSDENTYKYVIIDHVLEYMVFPEKVLNEIWRLCKKNAVIEILAPYYNNKGAYKDMNVFHFFSDRTFEILVKRNYKFELVHLGLIPTTFGKYLYSRWLIKKLGTIIPGIIAQVHVKLRVIK